MASEPERAAAGVPAGDELAALRAAAAACRACDLWEHATQTVFGEGAERARMMLVGEQPGDVEDRRGSPFVGPAGRVLSDALGQAGVATRDIYVTNAVKHFKWEPRGKRRIHKRPNTAEIEACHPWIEREVEVVRPAIVVCLGATAAQSVLGEAVAVTRLRGQMLPSTFGPPALITVHPSSILRGPPEDRAAAMEAFVGDLARARAALAG